MRRDQREQEEQEERREQKEQREKRERIIFKRIENDDIKAAVEKTLNLLKPKLPKEILVKPNLVEGAPPGKSISTNVNVLITLIEWLREKGAKKIVLADSSSHRDTQREYLKAGYSKLNPLIDSFVDLNNDPKGYIKIKVLKYLEWPEFEIAKTFADAKYVIHVPVAKCHHIVGLTCAIKGLLGVIAPRGFVSTKDYMHREWTYLLAARSKAKELSERRLFDLLCAVSSLNQQGFVLVDGSYCCEVYESSHDVKKTDFILASEDMIAADVVAAKVLGFEKEELPYLQLAQKQLGRRRIQLAGEKPKNFHIRKPSGWAKLRP